MSTVDEIHRYYQSKPELPESERMELIMLFKNVDVAGRGFLTMDQLVNSGILTADIAQSIFTSHDLDSNGYIDELEFLHMMCPEQYRVPGLGFAGTGEILSAWVSHRKRNSELLVSKGETSGYHLVHELSGAADHSETPEAFKPMFFLTPS